MNKIPISKNDINFYGDTEKERKANELIFDLTMEIDRLNNIINEFEKDIEEAYYELQDDDFINGKFMLKNFLDDLKELKETK